MVILTSVDTMFRRFFLHQWFQYFADQGLWQLRCPYVVRPDLHMFKISIIDTPAQRRLKVEGKLSDPWVNELRTSCRNASRDLEGRKLVIDVRSLTVISREGEEAIFELMKEGAKFCCAGILTRHVLKRLARRCRCQDGI